MRVSIRPSARAALVLCLALAAGCTATPAPGPPAAPAADGTGGQSAPARPAPTTPGPVPWLRPGDLDAGVAAAAVRHLAGRIGPRPGTGPAFGRAVAWVSRELERDGWTVRHQELRVPAGDSWGVPVPAGTSVNVVAEPPGFDPHRPHLVLGAHLDTVPQAPGAEDNASGVGVVLAAAAALPGARARLPVVLVAFGAEEPRGDTDADHHYGSRAFVASLGRARREAVAGMLALDRVGVGTLVPVGSALSGPDPAADRVARAARRAGVAVVREQDRSSDHWSFVRAGLPGVRLGSTPYAGYHSAADVPAVVDRRQLDRVARVVAAWLAP